MEQGCLGRLLVPLELLPIPVLLPNCLTPMPLVPKSLAAKYKKFETFNHISLLTKKNHISSFYHIIILLLKTFLLCANIVKFNWTYAQSLFIFSVFLVKTLSLIRVELGKLIQTDKIFLISIFSISKPRPYLKELSKCEGSWRVSILYDACIPLLAILRGAI